jgi:hypothetical protein
LVFALVPEAAGYSGDGGPATQAQLYHPVGVAVDGRGKIYVADMFNNAIRLLTPSSQRTADKHGQPGSRASNSLADRQVRRAPEGRGAAVRPVVPHRNDLHPVESERVRKVGGRPRRVCGEERGPLNDPRLVAVRSPLSPARSRGKRGGGDFSKSL